MHRLLYWLMVFIKHLLVPILSHTIKPQTHDLVWAPGRSDPKQSKRPIQAEGIFCPLREIALRKGCSSNSKLCPDTQVNIPGIRLINRSFEVAWCGECFFRVKRQTHSAR